MKLLVLASEGGAAQRRALQALAADASAHHDVRVLAPDSEGKQLRNLRVPVESWQPGALFDVLRSSGALRRALEHHRPDVVHAVGWAAAAVALGSLPAAYAARTLVTLIEPIQDAIPKKFVEQRLPELLRRAAFTTCAYPALANELAVRFGVARERIAVIPYGVSPTLPPNVARPPGRGGPIVGYVERLDPDRAWELAVDAVALLRGSLPGARLWLGAALPLRNLVRAYLREHALPLDVVGFDEGELGAFFGGIDLLVVPHGRGGLPFGLVQALVDGVPVVAANDAALAEALRTYRTRWLVENDRDSFARAIDEAWREIDRAWDEAQAERGRAIAAFDPAQVSASIATIYDRIHVAAVAANIEPNENE